MAGRYENGKLASRGDGLTGNDITHMLTKGLVLTGNTDCDGELVLLQSYFDEHLSNEFKYPRNVVTGAVGADTPRPAAQQALDSRAIVFVDYTTLPFVMTDTDRLVSEMADIREQIIAPCEYPTDGVILVVENPDIRAAMGATNHSHRWMVAAKTAGMTAQATVKNIQWQVGRTGRVTPVLQITPTTLTGATISSVTGHNAGSVVELGAAAGATVTITRSGDVIPYVTDCIPTENEVDVPEACPACNTRLRWQSVLLLCDNTACKGRRLSRMNHFFKTIGTIDLFGPAACENLIDAGITTIADIFSVTNAEFQEMGFGPGQAANLCAELKAARTQPVDDFRVLAAMGVSNLGRGDSKRLLKHTALRDVPTLTYDDIIGINGFGHITTSSILSQIPLIADDLLFLEANLAGIVETPRGDLPTIDSPISNKHIVFTGSMTQGNRADMIKYAEQLGAISQSSVNKKTAYLVAGEKVGASKLSKAESLGTTILSESEYLSLING